MAAARIANAHSFIRRLPQGYQTVLHSDGSNLSQGQRQLLSIARAAISRPPVLILDEATSSINTRTERLIEKGMDALMDGRTVFVIAHRLSTVRIPRPLWSWKKAKSSNAAAMKNCWNRRAVTTNCIPASLSWSSFFEKDDDL